MISKKQLLFPLTWKQSVLGSVYASIALILPAVLVSSTTYFHPLWIMSIYFCLYGLIRACSYDFESSKNPALVYRMVFGPLQLLTGTIIVASVIIGGSSLALLFVPVPLVLWYFGARNIAGAVYILQVETYEQAQVKRVMDRQREFAAQDKARAEEERMNEEILLADLAAFLGDSDQAGKGRANA